MRKKILAILLTLTMLLSTASLLGTTVMAETTDKVNTIAKYEDLENFVKSLATYDYAGETVTVTADITVNVGWTANDGKAAATSAPTGDNAKTLDTTVATKAFAGTFDGGNKTIKGLYINGSALIPTIAGATIKNVTLDNCYTNNASTCGYTAILAGKQISGSPIFENVTVSSSKIAIGTTNGSVGALLGTTTADGDTVTRLKFTDCDSIDNKLCSGAKTSLMGGIVGNFSKNNGEFLRCANSSEIYAIPASSDYKNQGYKSGGIIGACGGSATTYTISLIDCINEGKITSFTIAGGMVGDASSAKTIINKCINYGTLTSGDKVLSLNESNGNNYAGGMIGRINSATNCSISNSVNIGEINATAAVNNKGIGGGIVGQTNKDVSITDCVNTGNVNSTNKAGGIVGVNDTTGGIFDSVISVGKVNGKDDYSMGAILGAWAKKNESTSAFATFKDCYYTADANNYALGVYANVSTNGTKVGNFKLILTDTEVNKEFYSGVTNESDSENWDIFKSFNEVFSSNGAKRNSADISGVAVANILKSFNFGTDWMLTDTVPVPAGVFALMEKTAEDSRVDYKGYQKKISDDGKFNVRLIAGLDSTEFANTGFELYIVAKGDAVLTPGDDVITYTDTVYTSLNVYNGEGTLKDTVTAEALECTYISAIAVSGIPSTGTYTLVIKPYVTLSDGSGIEYGASYAMVIVDGAVTQHYAM